VVAAQHVLFSTAPRVAPASDGNSYIIKGPDLPLVFSEAAAYELAGLIGLSVPEFALCLLPGSNELWFGSRRKAFRHSADVLLRTGRVSNPNLLSEAVAFDVWVANDDRNLGNLVADSVNLGGRNLLELYAIDFERSQILAGRADRFRVAAMHPRTFWPREEMGRICRGLSRPEPFCERILGLRPDEIHGALTKILVGLNMPPVGWFDTAVDVLNQRRERIHSLVAEAWE
jgi:hypothetical protein